MKNNAIYFLTALSLVFFANYAVASWNAQTSPLGNSFTPTPVTIGLVSQQKTGSITVNNITSINGGRFNSIGIGIASGGIGDLSAVGDVKANKFCLGTRPGPEGCIMSWSEGLGLSGGQINSLFLWLTADTMGPSSISELADTVTIGTTASPKNLNVGVGMTIDNGGAKPQSALKLSQLAGASMTNLPSATKILSIDSATGEVVLVNADCSQ